MSLPQAKILSIFATHLNLQPIFLCKSHIKNKSQIIFTKNCVMKQ